jgi:aminoglycoside phosphotransferase (APT) family kinase protein
LTVRRVEHKKSIALDTPPAEVEFSERRIRRLLESQHPDLAALPLRIAACGWDNALYRLGDDFAVRLPRRALAAPLITNEQRWLPQLQPLLPLAIPSPRRIGVPEDWFPWHWSIVPWLPGETADVALPDLHQGEVLAAFLNALHVPAPEDAPRNAYRGVPLQQRAARFAAALQNLSAAAHRVSRRHRALWESALAAPFDACDTWIHGDLHPRNVLVIDGRLQAVVDWGDIARGDRATDLAAVWTLLPDRESRERAMASCREVSVPTWQRARGWALLLAVILLEASPRADSHMTVIARRILQRLLEGP